jgi:hypothetical protein
MHVTTRDTLWKAREGALTFLLASIDTMIASAATVTTHHYRPNPSTGNAKLLMLWQDILY